MCVISLLVNSHKPVVSLYLVYCWTNIQQCTVVQLYKFYSYFYKNLCWFHAINLLEKYIWNMKYTIQPSTELLQRIKCIQYNINDTKSCDLAIYFGRAVKYLKITLLGETGKRIGRSLLLQGCLHRLEVNFFLILFFSYLEQRFINNFKNCANILNLLSPISTSTHNKTFIKFQTVLFF